MAPFIWRTVLAVVNLLLKEPVSSAIRVDADLNAFADVRPAAGFRDSWVISVCSFVHTPTSSC